MAEYGVFGAELRRRRVEEGISLAALAKKLNYSKGYLSKIENGQRPPTVQLARLADTELGAGGELRRLVSAQVQLNRRDVIVLGMASMPVLTAEVRRADAADAAEDPSVELLLRNQFDAARSFGQQAAPGLVMPVLHGGLTPLLQLLGHSRTPATRARLSLLAARFAEYLGWMAQEAGNVRDAVGWTEQSARIAGDSMLAANALVRQAELAMYADDAERTISLARQALRHPMADARIRGLAAHRLAQGFALRGDYDGCRQALDTAERWLREPGTTRPVLGSTTVADLGGVVTGWCYYDLGKPVQAAELLERALASTPQTARRARALHGTRLALCYEAANEVEEMCRVATHVLATKGPIGSATVRGELKSLKRAVVRRISGSPAARDLHTKLTAALSEPE